jgi:segregation and condensation protein B
MPAPPDAAGAARAFRSAGKAVVQGPDEDADQGNAAGAFADDDTGGTSASGTAHGSGEGATPDDAVPPAAYGDGADSMSFSQAGTAAEAERTAPSSTAASDAAVNTAVAEAVPAPPPDGGDMAERDAPPSAASDASDDGTAAEAASATLADEGDGAECKAPPSVASAVADDAAFAETASAQSPAGTDAPEAPADPALFAHALRIAEALVFASDRPVTPARLGGALPPGCDPRAVLTALSAACAGRPVELVEVAGGFSFRTAPELAPAITRVVEAPRRLPRAAMETLAIVAYHQPVTRAEIEEIRGASLSQSTLELLLDAALIAPRGRKEVPGRPSLWGTTPRFLEQFGLKAIGDLPPRGDLVNEPTLPLSPPPDAAPPPHAA